MAGYLSWDCVLFYMLDIWVGYTCSGIIVLFRWNRQVLYFYWCMDRLFMCWIYWILIIWEFYILTYFNQCDDMHCVWVYTCFLIGWLTGYRAEVADMVRQAVLLQPELAFNFAKQWLETTICKPIDTGNRIFYCDQNTHVHVELIHISFEFL